MNPKFIEFSQRHPHLTEFITDQAILDETFTMPRESISDGTYADNPVVEHFDGFLDLKRITGRLGLVKKICSPLAHGTNFSNLSECIDARNFVENSHYVNTAENVR